MKKRYENRTCNMLTLMSTVALACLASGGAALAQGQLAQATKAAGDEPEVVVITAEKRTSTVQDTPISITALTGEALRTQGVSGVQGIVTSVPGLSMRTSGPGQTELELRGLSSSGGSSPTVGLYLNDYALSPAASSLTGKSVIDPDLYDLNRVEVLRGPQGTLYGSGSMGGTVKLLTNQPNLTTFQASVDGSLSSTDGGGVNRGGSFMVNVPVVNDVLAFRVVFTDKVRDGWITRVDEPNMPAPNQPNDPNFPACAGVGFVGCVRGNVLGVTPALETPRTNWERMTGGRVEVEAKPTDKLTINFLALTQNLHMGGYDEYDSPPGLPEYHYQPNNNQEPISDKFQIYGLTANYDLRFADITSATAYYSRTESQTQDTAEALYNDAPYYFGTVPAYYNSPFNETDTTRSFSEELRLVSKGNGPLRWTFGAFYSNFTSIFNETNDQPAIVAAQGGLADNPLGIIYQARNPYHVKQYGLFGEGTYSFANDLKLTVGTRWYKFDTRVLDETAGVLGLSGTGSPAVNTFSTSSSGFNPKATLSYEHLHDLTLYATVSRGFRPGGANQQIPANLCSVTNETYEPDSVWNYEAGEKARLLGGRVTLNADFFYVRWLDVQQSINQSCGYPLTVNAGTAKSYGPELELSAKLTEKLVLSLSGTYTHAALTSGNAFVRAGVTPPPGLGLLNVPKYTENTSLTYTTPVGGEWELKARLANSYVGKTLDIDYTYGTLPAYDIITARLGLTNENISAFLYVDNLTDERANMGINTTGFAYTIPSLIRVVTNQPRTIGVDIKYNY